MGLTGDVRDALDAALLAGTSLTISKAWLSFDKPALSAPSAFIEWTADEMLDRAGRMGGGANWRTTFTCYLFCANEVQLMVYVDSVRTTFDGWKRATISTYNMQITAGRIERIPQDAETPEALRYSAQFVVNFEYTR